MTQDSIVMLSAAKHLVEVAVRCGEMLHFVQHDSAIIIANHRGRENRAPTSMMMTTMFKGSHAIGLNFTFSNLN